MLAAVRLTMLAALAAVLAPGEASAQPARNYKADPKDNSLSNRGQIVRKFVNRGEGDRAEFEAYFSKYFFPSLTDPSSKALGVLGEHTGSLFKNYLYKAQDPSVQKWLSDRALAWGARVARDRAYHPAVRLNAVMVVGRIDDTYDSNAPVPSAQANQFLCQIAAACATSERAPKYLLTGALTGLERHSRFLSGMPAQRKQQTAGTLYRVLNLDELPGDYAPGVRDWVYLQAAQAVANLKTPGPRGVFMAAMAKRVADANLEIDTRVEIASMLEQLNAQPGAPAEPVVRAIAGLAAAVADREREFAEEFEDRRSSRGRSSLVPGRDPSARRLKAGDRNGMEMIREPMIEALDFLQQGVKATIGFAGEEDRATLKRIDDAITPALEAATDVDGTGDLTLARIVKEMAAEIKEAASAVSAPPEAEPVAEEAAPEAEAE